MGVGESGCICVKPFVTSKGTYYAFSDWLSYTCVCVTVYTVIHTRVCVCVYDSIYCSTGGRSY